MERMVAYKRLLAAGCPYYDATAMLNYLLDERLCPSSRKKGNKPMKIRGLMLSYGVDPDEIEFAADARPWGNSR